MPDRTARSGRVRPFRLSGKFTFVGLKNVLQPVQFDEALLTHVTGILTDVTYHIRLPDIPIRYDPQRDNHAGRDGRDLRNAFHPRGPPENRRRSSVAKSDRTATRYEGRSNPVNPLTISAVTLSGMASRQTPALKMSGQNARIWRKALRARFARE